MPFTPFHLGPSLLVGMLLFSFLDLPALLAGSVMVDIEGVYVLLVGPPGASLHGFLHSYLGATALGLVIAIIMVVAYPFIRKLASITGIAQESSRMRIVVSALVGTWSHVLLDSLLYGDMDPFYPNLGNPFRSILNPSMKYSAVYGFCVITFIAGFILYLRRAIRSN